MKYIFFLCAALLAMHAYGMDQRMNLIIENKLSQRVHIIYEPHFKETTYTTFRKEEPNTSYRAITSMHPESFTIISLLTPKINLKTRNFIPISRLPIVKKDMLILHPIKNNEIKVTQGETVLVTLKALYNTYPTSPSYVKTRKPGLDKDYKTSDSDEGCW